MRKVLATGAACFIGFHLPKRLIDNTMDEIIGIDSLSDYYDVNLRIIN
jgi:UDP-glucuronate 4-epimerase